VERQGASHQITQTRPGSGNSTDLAKQTRLLKSAVTRTRNKVDTLESAYGARDVPQSSPHYGPIAAAREASQSARQAWAEHMRNTGQA
jgi:hypothetical protein